MSEKTCSDCQRSRPRGEFHRSKAKPDGLQPRCKECSKERTQRWRAKNPDHSRRLARESYHRQFARNPDRFRSLNAAEQHLRAIARSGAITLVPRISRGIVLPPSSQTTAPK